MNFFGREPGRVLERLSNILLFQVRMVLEHFLDARAVSELTKGDLSPADLLRAEECKLRAEECKA
ncbi:MAG TPA: hypothetical protein VHC69_28030 [Polyangiaceae bacterium]|nr:hypothetical protein [Polyangiaceae bacterium]